MTEPSSEVKALRYAEDTLGVHTTHAAAIESRDKLDSLHNDLLQCKNKRRFLESYLQDREMELLEEQRGANPDMSQAAFERHMKVVLSNDGDVRETRDELATLAGEIDDLQYKIEIIHLDIKIAVARLQELGGYFEFLAVIKQANNANKSTENKGPW